MRESRDCTSDERMNEETDETLLMYVTGKERPCKNSSMLIFAVFSQVLETWATYDPGDEETQGRKRQTPRQSNLQGNPLAELVQNECSS